MNNDAITRDSLSEAVSLFSGTTVVGALYTLAVVLYCLSARLSYLQLRNLDGKIKRQTVLTFTVASLMMICATVDLALANIERQITYINYGALPGGPLGLAAGLHTTTVTRVRYLILLLNNLLISGVLVSFWRLHLGPLLHLHRYGVF
jgi:hypothetical protein